MIKRHIVIVFILIVASCDVKQTTADYPDLPDYDLSDPIMIHLRTDLDEISGIVYYPKDTSVFAINDELGVLYKIYLRKQVKISKWKFAADGDYEDLVLLDSNFYALQSNGNIKVFRFHGRDSISINNCTIPFEDNNEFESLYYDSYYQKLLLPCKDCASDSRKVVSAFSFDPADHTYSASPSYTLNAIKIGDLLHSGKVKFKPSAAAIHPLTKDLYLISAVNRALVIADRDGNIKEAYPLNPQLFKQPEGITFTPEGDLLISNESAQVGAPNILIFKYKPKGK